MLLVNFSLSKQNCTNFYPQSKFFIRQYLLHSVILVSGKAETGSHKKEENHYVPKETQCQ